MIAETTNTESNIMHLWADLYLNQKMTPLEKRLYDWWIGEGFFYVSNFKETEEGTQAELMLLLGNSADSLLASNQHSASAASQKANEKLESGWELLPFGADHYILKDTPQNRVRVETLLNENIRYFSVLEYHTKEIDGRIVLKSVVINVMKRGELA